MKSKMILAAIAFLFMVTGSASAQSHYRNNGRGNGNNGGYNNGGYNNGGNSYGYNNGNYNNGGCNNGNYYGRGRGRGNGYGRARGYYRPRPVAYCQPVVIAPGPRYYAPPRYAYGRPRVNINIGF